MTRPLYRTNGACEAKGHAGLWYDKFCDRWQRENDAWTLSGQHKTDWIKEVIRPLVGDEHHLEQAATRLACLARARRGQVRVVTASSRFVTGLGRSHPVENGFAWHHTLGVPYLPGSSLKGLVSAWARAEADPARMDVHERVFGTPGKVGEVVFADVIPLKPVQLEVDVITPHFPAWEPDQPPGDWGSPVPIPFLATAAGTHFTIALWSRDGTPLDPDLWPSVSQALQLAGAGAKTAVGYGRFALSQRETEKLQERAAAEAPPPPGQDQDQQGPDPADLKGLSEGQVLTQVRLRLLAEEAAVDPAANRAFAEAVIATRMPERWKRGEKVDPRTQTGAKKLKLAARAVREAAGQD